MARKPSLLRQLEDSIDLVERQKDERRRLQIEHLARAARSLLLSDPNQVGPAKPKRTRRPKPLAIQQPTELLLYCEGLLTVLLRTPRLNVYTPHDETPRRVVQVEADQVDRICRELNGLLEPHRLPKAA